METDDQEVVLERVFVGRGDHQQLKLKFLSSGHQTGPMQIKQERRTRAGVTTCDYYGGGAAGLATVQ
jgi:hypothetical protein